MTGTTMIVLLTDNYCMLLETVSQTKDNRTMAKTSPKMANQEQKTKSLK